jgi:hypothetical protein
MIEKYYSINEVSEQLNMSFERTRQLVKDDPGARRNQRAANVRSRSVYRIPETFMYRILVGTM